MADDPLLLTEFQKGARAKQVETLRTAAGQWETEGGKDGKDMAARYRAEAREIEKDPDFGTVVLVPTVHAQAVDPVSKQVLKQVPKQVERYARIVNTVTAKTERRRENKVRAQESPERRVPETGGYKKPWHDDADPILRKLRAENPDWDETKLFRKGLRKQWKAKPGFPKLPRDRAIDTHVEKLLKTGRRAEEAK